MEPSKFKIECTGYSIVADWYQGADTGKVLLFLPGYTSTREHQRDLVPSLVKETGTSAVVIDYSGHGDSPFELRDTRPAQHFLEVIYAFEWIEKNHPGSIISVMGSSYGGFLATQLTKYREFSKLVLKVPAIYKPDAFYDLWSSRLDNIEEYDSKMERYRKDSEALSKHPLLARASSFKGRTLVIVHGQDKVVPVETTDAFIKAFQADNFTEPNFAHSSRDSANIMDHSTYEKKFDQYKTKIADWLNKA